MARVRCETSKWFLLVLFAFCLAYSDAVQESNELILTLSDLDQMRNDIIFLKSINESGINISPLNEADHKCLSELYAIENGIRNSELWAVKSNR